MLLRLRRWRDCSPRNTYGRGNQKSIDRCLKGHENIIIVVPQRGWIDGLIVATTTGDSRPRP